MEIIVTSLNSAPRVRAILALAVATALMPPMNGQAPSAAGVGPSVGIQNGGDLVGPEDLPLPLAGMLQTMGGRFTSADTGQIQITGTTTDASGARSAQITIQSPGQFAYREGKGRAITFNGTGVLTNSGQASLADEPILESLLAHLPDSVILQAANGGGLRKIASHVRTDDGKTKLYTGPYWTVFEFAPAKRKGFAWGQALQQELFIAVDEKTRLIAEVRMAVKVGKSVQVTQTQFQNWFQQGAQWFPGKVVRLEGGVQTLSFQIQTVSTGPASATATAFPP